MKPLRYHAPSSAAQACALLAEHEAAAVLGGGTMLLPALRRGELSHPHLIDLRRAGLSGVSASSAGMVRVGAMTTYADLDRSSGALTGRAAVLATAARGITGGAQLRNQATVGGSACYANPASDMPGCLVGAGARVMIHGRAGEREVAADEFFLGAFRTALQPADLVTGFLLPTDPVRIGYYKLKLAEGSWPIATATAVLGPAGHPASYPASRQAGPQTRATVTLGGVAVRPVRVDISGMLTKDGRVTSASAFTELIHAAVDQPWGDELAPGSYRRQVAPVVARRAVERAIGVTWS